MKRLIFAILMSLAIAYSFSFATETLTFNFQGRLCNSSGNPVPDGNYSMRFLIYADSLGGTPLWNELHPAVPVDSSYFNVDLGTLVSCSLSIPARENLYLATQIGTEPPMARRFRISASPHAGVARRIYGDLQTSPGSMLIHDPENSQSTISLNTGSENMGIVIEERTAQRSIGIHNGSENMGVVIEERLADPINGRRFHAGIDSGEVNLGLDGPNGQKMLSGSAKPGSLGKITWGLFNPQPEPPARDNPVIEMATGVGGEGSITMFNPQPEPPGPDPSKIIEISTGIGSQGSIVMFNPQPEPPASDPLKLIEISNGVGGDAGIYMFNPQPEPPATDPFFGLTARANGPELAMYAPQVGGAILVNNHPQINIRCDSSASRFLFQRAYTPGAIPESTGIYMHADSLRSYMAIYGDDVTQVKLGTSAGTGYASFFDDGSEYMGIEPSPWHSGGDLIMKGTGGINTMILGSNGTIGMLDDGTEYMGVEPSPFHAGGDLTMSAGGVQTMVFGSDGTMSMLDDGSEYMGIEPSPWHAGGDLTMYSAAGGPTLVLASNGMISVGTSAHTNIITVQQYSATDPVADAWTNYSSRRWKTNIQPLQGSLGKVMRLQGVSYDQREGGKHDIGLIAEDVGQVIPEVVVYEDNGVDAKSVDYARLSALLIEAVKEQQKTIDQLKSELGDLKADLRSNQASSQSGE